jgi:hypothetical protein
MYVAHGRLDVIVPGHVLQRKGIGVLACLGQKRMPEQPGIGVGHDLFPQARDLRFQGPGARGRFLRCFVYGMPRSCAETGILNRVLPLDEITGEIAATLCHSVRS